jgi:flagellar hook-associated protein 1 FlgK
VVLSADSFDSVSTVGGGVSFAGTVDSRDEYLESNVRQSVSQQGAAAQSVTDYTALQEIVPVDGTSGISTALDNFFSAFSSLTTTPNDATARQLALDQATQVAQSFQQANETLQQAEQGTQENLTEQVNQVNTIAATIASINKQYEQNADAATDPGLNAQMTQALENLSQYADVTVLKQDNGTVLVNAGQSLLVSGDQSMPLQWASGAGQRVLEDSQGNDMSTSLQSGSLSELLDQANNVEPAMQSNLNQMAQSFATAVNSALQSGVDESGNAPTQDLFSFDPVAGAAATITVNSLQPADLALAHPTAPGGNAVAVQIVNLQQADLVGGTTLTQFYGGVAAQVGQSLSNAQNDETTAESLVTQAETMRSDTQGVSLDQEAMNTLEYQRAYDATSQFVKVIDQLTQDVIGMLS